MKEKEEGFNQKYSKYAEIEELVDKGDKLAAAEKLGLTPENFVEGLISKEKLEEEKKTVDYQVKTLQEKLEKMEAERQKEKAEYQKKEIMSQLDGYKRDITDFITKNADKYEICATQGLTEDVYEAIKNTYEATGEVVSMEEAVEAVEAHYEQEFETKWAKVNKLRSRIAPEPVVEEKPSSPPVVEVKEEKKPIRTITNSDSSSSSNKSLDDMTDEEREEAAKKLLKTTWHKSR